jgi:competence protein ComFC
MVRALDILFPVQKKCAFCDRRAHKLGVCKLCIKEVVFIEGSLCNRCGRSLEVSATCADCYRRKKTFFCRNRSAVKYNEKLKGVISLYKYRGHEGLLNTLSELLQKAFYEHYENMGFDCLTFVPLHEKRLRERGFNQAQQLAISLSLRTGIPVISLLSRSRPTGKQSKKDRTARLQTLSGAFHPRPHSHSLRRVLLIDDVYTTTYSVSKTSTKDTSVFSTDIQFKFCLGE